MRGFFWFSGWKDVFPWYKDAILTAFGRDFYISYSNRNGYLGVDPTDRAFNLTFRFKRPIGVFLQKSRRVQQERDRAGALARGPRKPAQENAPPEIEAGRDAGSTPAADTNQ